MRAGCLRHKAMERKELPLTMATDGAGRPGDVRSARTAVERRPSQDTLIRTSQIERLLINR